MKTKSDQTYASNLLHCRENGYVISRIIRKGWVAYLLRILLIVGSMLYLPRTGDPLLTGALLWVNGMLIGAMVRDLIWMKQIKTTWPFTEKVTDWDVVEDLSQGGE